MKEDNTLEHLALFSIDEKLLILFFVSSSKFVLKSCLHSTL
jgi:hypothetical protein